MRNPTQKTCAKAKKLIKRIRAKLPSDYRRLDSVSMNQQVEELCVRYQNHVAFTKHIAPRVIPLITLVRQLTKQYNLSQDQARELVQNAYYQSSVIPGMRVMKWLFKIPGAKKVFAGKVKEVALSNFGEKQGFVIENPRWGELRAQFDIMVCPYQEVCEAEGMSDLTDVFCTSDDFINDVHPAVCLQRTETLGRGGKRCDFDYSWRDEA